MPSLKLKQLQYESECWKRQLGFMMEENVHFKVRLSEILQDEFNLDLLEDCEKFQNIFINRDHLFHQLENEIQAIDKLLVRGIFEDGSIVELINLNFEKLRAKINVAERQFEKLKYTFIRFLSKIYKINEKA